MEENVFVIESVTFNDEQKRRREGKILTEVLNLAGKKPTYFYIRTQKELVAVLKKFGKSDFRYLHISCHGSKNEIATTLDTIPFEEFGEIVRPHLRERRLFLSTCDATNTSLAKVLIPGSGCHSLIGPKGTIHFGDAALVWASFYHLMFQISSGRMKRQNINQVLQRLCETFDLSLRYYGSSRHSPFFTTKVFPTHNSV